MKNDAEELIAHRVQQRLADEAVFSEWVYGSPNQECIADRCCLIQALPHLPWEALAPEFRQQFGDRRPWWAGEVV